jgi:hypothetical protein
MIKLTKEQFEQLITYAHNTQDLGYICEQGAVVGDAKWVLKEENNEYFLAHISEFIQEGCLIRERGNNNAN